MSALDNRIAAQYRKLEVLDVRIGRLMGKRVDEEEKLANLLKERNARDKVPVRGRFDALISVAEESDL